MIDDGNRCTHTKADGSRCKAQAQQGGLCFWHDPALARQRTEARRRGGRAGERLTRTLPEDTPRFPLDTIGDVQAALSDLFYYVATGRVGVKVGNTLSAIATVLVRSIETHEIDRRLKALEQEREAEAKYDRWS